MTITRIKKITSSLLGVANSLQPLWWLVVRLAIASVFFKSGLTKIEDFDMTLDLFRDEYSVPLLPPYYAAVSSTFFELAMPVALVLGFATRLAALPLLAMTAVIEFTYQHHMEHMYWAILLTGIVLHGAGKFSLDHLIAKRLAAA